MYLVYRRLVIIRITLFNCYKYILARSTYFNSRSLHGYVHYYYQYQAFYFHFSSNLCTCLYMSSQQKPVQSQQNNVRTRSIMLISLHVNLLTLNRFLPARYRLICFFCAHVTNLCKKKKIHNADTIHIVLQGQTYCFN